MVVKEVDGNLAILKKKICGLQLVKIVHPLQAMVSNLNHMWLMEV